MEEFKEEIEEIEENDNIQDEVIKFVELHPQLQTKNNKNRLIWEQLEEKMKIEWKTLSKAWQNARKKLQRITDFEEATKIFQKKMEFTQIYTIFKFLTVRE